MKIGGDYIHIFLSIDDTDSIDSRGTGELASLISKAIEEKSWGRCSGITRHQLLIHPDVPYTSHNSSMCFEADINELCLEKLTEYACDFLEKESAEGSDPGLCVAVQAETLETELLIEFGKKAKKQIILIPEAYDLAKKCGVHLSEHGGTGQGVIGALAGIGLRLTGNDGRFKGKVKLISEKGTESVDYILSHTGFERVKDIDGRDLNGEEIVVLGGDLKSVFLDGKSTLLVFSKIEESTGGFLWKVCNKQELRAY